LIRSVASDVSALSSGVANGHQTIQHVSSSLSKIPYGGFSPVRLQTGSPRRPSSSSKHSYLYAVQVRPSDPYGHYWHVNRAFCHRTSRPEALGSPAGYVVPPGHRLLWPHPRLWSPPADLCFIRRVSVAQLLPTGRPGLPQFTLRVSTHVPHSVPRWTARLLLTVTSSHVLAFTIFVLVRQPTYPQKPGHCGVLTRLQVSLYATARRACSPCPGQDFYFRAFIPGGRPPKTSSITTWAYSQFP
jgi:hypothetical protein